MLIKQDPEPVTKLPFKQIQWFRLCQFYTEVEFGCVFVFICIFIPNTGCNTLGKQQPNFLIEINDSKYPKRSEEGC